MRYKLKYTFRAMVGGITGGVTLCSIMTLFFSCSSDYFDHAPIVNNDKEFKLSLGGAITRSARSEAIVSDMRLFCFSQSGDDSQGNRGSLSSIYHHIVSGLNYSGMTLTTQQMRVGKWDMAIVSAQGAVLTPPVVARQASEQLMYQYAPKIVDGKSSDAHQIYYRFLRLPEITGSNHNRVYAGVARNMARVKIVVQRAVDVDVAGDTHTITLNRVPTKISWAGTLLRTVSQGTYLTDFVNPDTESLTGKVSFTPAAENGIFKSDTLEFIIPAHRGSDFWNADGTTQNMSPKDTLKCKMNISVSFAKPAGRGVFEKQNVEIPIVARCNETLVLQLKMKDVEVEVIPTIKPWADVAVNGDISNPFLNVSELETTVYDGAASRLFFWSNQPSDSVYVMTQGRDASDNMMTVNNVFDRLCGASRANFSYKTASDGNGYEGYIDLSNITSASNTSKIYIYAGGLKREIKVNTTLTTHGAKKITTPYVGTFHRWNQLGERIVTWYYSGEWNALVEGDGAVVSQVAIDRLASGAYRNNQLYSSNSGNAELYKVDDSGGSVSGNGRIYFRVGWKSSGNISTPRYAKVVVRKGLVVGSGEVIQTLYIRQGEASDYVMRRSESGTSMVSRPDAAKYTPYNITDPIMTGGSSVMDSKTIAIYGGSFTAYPSQAGAFFQWARDPEDILIRKAYHPVNSLGALSGWQNNSPNQHWVDGSADNAICPEGYSRPHDGPISNIDVTNPQAATSELRQSLWLSPQNGTVPNNANTIWGYYADGFFDRRELNPADSQGSGSSANIAASWTDGSVAYAGNLFYNPVTNASLFFPAAGYRSNFNGAVMSAGTGGYFWTSTSYDKDVAWGLNTSSSSVISSYYSRASAFNLRCVESPYHTITFYANGGSFSDGTTVKIIKITQGNSGYLLPQPANAPNGTGYAVWSSAASADLSVDNTYSPQLKITPNQDMIYYARWTSSRLFFGHNGWAGSNIYWDGSKLTFDDFGVTANQTRQGVYFMWGSLVALSPMGSIWGETSMILHVPNTVQATNGSWNTADAGWGYIPRLGWQDALGDNSSSNPAGVGIASLLPKISYVSNQSYTYEHHDSQKNIGDICKYITDRGWAPGANENPRVEWRMPINIEFSPTGISEGYYNQVNSLSTHQPSTNKNGDARYDMGFLKVTELYGPGTPMFPASGYRAYDGSTTKWGNGYYPGQALGYWSGSQGTGQTAETSHNGGALDYYIYNNNVTCALGFARNSGLAVRCVKVN